MPRTVTIKTGYNQVALPDGGLYDDGDTVVLTDEQWGQVSGSAVGVVLTDGGAAFTDLPPYSEDDDGKSLTIASGVPVWA